MSLAPTTSAMTPAASHGSASLLSRAQEAFAEMVSRGTGLNIGVVRAWVLAENGPPNNFLGIRNGAGGAIQPYASPQEGAAAVVRTLNTHPSYAPILRAAGQGGAASTPLVQLGAIVASPWEGGHYAGAKDAKPGTLLRGTYARVLAADKRPTSDPLISPGDIGGAITGAAGAVAGIPGDIWGAVDSVPKAIEAAVKSGEQWVAKEAVIGLGYLTFTILALLLVAVALYRMSAPLLGNAQAAQPGAGAIGKFKTPPVEIPF